MEATQIQTVAAGVAGVGFAALVWGVWLGRRALRRLQNCDERIDALKKELEYARVYDAVTGALNYQAFSKSAFIQLRLAHRHDWPVTLLVLDVVDLERINLKYGFGAGDAVLKRIAEAIAKAIRSSDVVGRFEGSKFYILLQECDRQSVGGVLERIVRETVQNPPEYEKRKISFETRAASVTARGKQAYLQEMIDEAEKGLLQLKKEGKKFIRLTYGEEKV